VNENTRSLLIGGIAVAVVGACIVAGAFGLASDGGSGGSDEADGVEAYVMCQGFVKDRLRAPGTAKFPPAARADVDELAGNAWRVRAWVDAENAFGGEVRTDWECRVAYEGGGGWRLDGLEMEE
jgi:hypothetical protein